MGIHPFRPHVSLNLLPKTLFPDVKENPKEEPKPSRCGADQPGPPRLPPTSVSKNEPDGKGEVGGGALDTSQTGQSWFIQSLVHPFSLPPTHLARNAGWSFSTSRGDESGAGHSQGFRGTGKAQEGTPGGGQKRERQLRIRQELPWEEGEH